MSDGGKVPVMITNLGECKAVKDNFATNFKVSFQFPTQGVESFPEIIKLFVDPLSSKHYERQVFLLNRTLKYHCCGFFLKELECLVEIINECVKRLDECPKFMEVITEIARICRLPFLLQKTSDELRYRYNSVKCIEQLGYLLRLENNRLRKQICRTLVQFYNANCHDVELSDENIRQTTEEFNKLIVNESSICESVSKILPLVGRDGSLRHLIYELIVSLSNNSEKICNTLLREEIIPYLCKSLDEAVEEGDQRMIFMVTQVSWNVVEFGISALLYQQLANEHILSNFKDIFVKYMVQSFCKEDRQMRNDFLAIICLMVSRCSNLPFVEIGFVKVIAVFATFMEVRSQNVLVKHMKLSPCEKEDFELKKMLFNALILLLTIPGSLKIYSECRVIQALARYLHCGPFHLAKSSSSSYVDETSQQTFDPSLKSTCHPQSFWFPKQYEEMHKLALFTLSRVAPLMLKDVIDSNVPKFLADMFISCIQLDLYGEDGTCQIKGMNDPLFINKDILKGCVAVIHNLVITKNAIIVKKFCECKILKPLLFLLNQLANQQGTKAEDWSLDKCIIHIQIDLITITSIISEEEALNEEGACILMKYLRMDSNVATPYIGKFNLLMSSIHCTWTCIVGHNNLENCFLEKQGICLLLNILQKCPHNLKGMILGCLLDFLFVKKEAIGQFKSWIGIVDYENYLNSVVTIKDGTTLIKKEHLCLGDEGPKMMGNCKDGSINALQLLFQLWRDEEARMGVLRDEMGIIIDAERPLQSKEQQQRTLVVQSETQSSASIVEIFENIRTKIYLIFAQIGFMNLPVVFDRDKITLTIIENYLDLKEAEVVKELIEEMSAEGMQPINLDRESIQVMLRTICAKQQKVKEMQEDIKNCLERFAISEEQIYYSKLKDNIYYIMKLLKEPGKLSDRDPQIQDEPLH